MVQIGGARHRSPIPDRGGHLVANPEALRHGAHVIGRLEDLAQAEPADISDIPAIGEQAAAVLEAARTEVVRRRIPLGGEDTAAA